jgi:hypothetical protein
VLYILGLKKNFLLVSAMENKGFSITFQRGQVLIHLEKTILDNVVVVGAREGTLYRLLGNHVQDLVHNNDNLCELWHMECAEGVYLERMPRLLFIEASVGSSGCCTLFI